MLIGGCSLLTLATGLLLLRANDGRDTSISGVLIRVGAMLLVLWFGYPTLVAPGGKQSLGWLLASLCGLFLVAFRPRLFLAVFVIAAAALALNWCWRRIHQSLDER